MAHCLFFHKLGELSYQWIFPASQLAIFATTLLGVRAVGWSVGLLLLTGAGFLPALVARERFRDVARRQPQVAFWASIRASMASSPFRVVSGLVLCNTIMGMFTSSLDYYVIVYYLHQGDVAAGSLWKALLSSGYAIVGVAAIPAVLALSRRCGKRETLRALYALTILGGLLKWFTFRPNFPSLMLLDPLICGPIWVAVQMLLGSMIADICDEDELASGQRREGMFGAIYSWIQKTMMSLSVLGSGIALALSGFEQRLGAAQAPHTFAVMRLLLVASTALPPIAALWLLRSYRLDEAAVLETQHRLADQRHRGAAAPAAAPVT